MAVAPGTTIVTIASLTALALRSRLVFHFRFDIVVARSVHHLVVALILVEVVVALATRMLFLEAGAALAEHTEIMVCELQIIFALDAVACELRIARHALVFFKQLRRIAALPVILAITAPGLSSEVRSPLTSTPAPAAALTIIDQIPTSLTRSFPFCLEGQASARRRRNLTLSFRTAPQKALSIGRLRRGWSGFCPASLKGASPVLSTRCSHRNMKIQALFYYTQVSRTALGRPPRSSATRACSPSRASKSVTASL